MASPQFNNTADQDFSELFGQSPTLLGDSNEVDPVNQIMADTFDSEPGQGTHADPNSPSFFLDFGNTPGFPSGDQVPDSLVDPQLFDNAPLAPARSRSPSLELLQAHLPSDPFNDDKTGCDINDGAPNPSQAGEIGSDQPVLGEPASGNDAAANAIDQSAYQTGYQQRRPTPSIQSVVMGGTQSVQNPTPDAFGSSIPPQNNTPHHQLMRQRYAQFRNSGYQQVQRPQAPTTPTVNQHPNRFPRPPPIMTPANVPGNMQMSFQSPVYPPPSAGLLYPNGMPYFGGFAGGLRSVPATPVTPVSSYYVWFPEGAQQPPGTPASSQTVLTQPAGDITKVDNGRRKRKRGEQPSNADMVYHNNPEIPPLMPLPSWGGEPNGPALFQYNDHQELKFHIAYSASQIRQFIEENPRKPKLWIQQSPPQAKDRLKGVRNKCCWECCPAKDRVIETGWLRVGFYEFPKETRDDGLRDPLKPTTQMHLYCYEQCFDPVVDWQAGRLEPDDFVFSRETKQLTSLNKNSDKNIVVETFVPWFKYKSITNQPRPYEQTLSYALNRHHLDHQTSARQTKRDKGNENKRAGDKKTIDIHVGNLLFYISKTRNASVYVTKNVALPPGNGFQLRTLQSTLAHQRPREAPLGHQTDSSAMPVFGYSTDNDFQMGGMEPTLPNTSNGQNVAASLNQADTFGFELPSQVGFNEWLDQQGEVDSFLEPNPKRRRQG